MTLTYTRRRHLVTRYDPLSAVNGFTLINPFGTGDAWLLDMRGRFVHHWKIPSCSCELLPDGHLLGISGENLVELDWDGNKVWSYEDKNASTHFCRLANGNTLFLRHAPVPVSIAAKVEGGIPGTEGERMLVDALIEVSPEGKEVWQWLGYEHLDPEIDAICAICYRDEWTDGASCGEMPDGNILVCLSRTHTIYIIEKKTGNIKWRWSGAGELAHPRSTTMLENGNILVFDSGFHSYGVMPVGYSRVLELDPKENKIVWEYRGHFATFFYSTFMGFCQRLPGGNTLVTESQTGRVFEITYDSKEIVWEFINPFYNDHPLYGHNNILLRAYRYGIDYPGIKDYQLASEKFTLLNEICQSGVCVPPAEPPKIDAAKKLATLKIKDMPPPPRIAPPSKKDEKEVFSRLKLLGY